MAPVFGCFHSFVPSARPVKLATVLGALSSNSSIVNVPRVVSKWAWVDICVFYRREAWSKAAALDVLAQLFDLVDKCRVSCGDVEQSQCLVFLRRLHEPRRRVERGCVQLSAVVFNSGLVARDLGGTELRIEIRLGG